MKEQRFYSKEKAQRFAKELKDNEKVDYVKIELIIHDRYKVVWLERP